MSGMRKREIRKVVRSIKRTSTLFHELVDRGDLAAIERVVSESRAATVAELGPSDAADAADRAFIQALRWGDRDARHRAVDVYEETQLELFISALEGES